MPAFVYVNDVVVNVDKIYAWEPIVVERFDGTNDVQEEATWIYIEGRHDTFEAEVPFDVFTSMVARALSNAERGVFIPVDAEQVLTSDKPDSERIDRNRAPY